MKMPLRAPGANGKQGFSSGCFSVPDPGGAPSRPPRSLDVFTSGEFPNDQGDPDGAFADAMVQLLQLAANDGWSVASAGPKLQSAGHNQIDHVATCGWPYPSLCPRCYPLALTTEAHDAPSLN